MAGFVKLHRSLIRWEWFDDSKTLHIFLTILLNANHKDGKWHGVEVKKGQWITGRKKLASLTKISEQSVRTILNRLVSSGEITIKPTNKHSLITVVNWDTYQLQEKQPTNKPPTINQQSTTNKNEKKETIDRVINYLNKKTGKSYKSGTKATSEIINARLGEGFSPDDFKAAIDNQCRDWIGTEYEKFLRPSTLFAPTKFDGYVQNVNTKTKKVHQ